MLKENKPDFEKAQNAATNLLLKQNISNLRIDVKSLFLDKAIIIDSIQHYCLLTGTRKEEYIYNGFSGAYVLKLKTGLFIILYDEDDSIHRQRWGIAHELGHIYLEHDNDESKQEVEANFFAAQLLMPEIIIRYANKLQGHFSIYDVSKYFDVSEDAAQRRIKTLNNKMIRFSSEEQQLLRKMITIVEKEFLNLKVLDHNDSLPYLFEQIG